MTYLFERFLGKFDVATKVPPVSKDKVKSILGALPGFPPKETIVDAPLALMDDVGLRGSKGGSIYGGKENAYVIGVVPNAYVIGVVPNTYVIGVVPNLVKSA
ncbi:hypothetical protein PVK06_005117 [Gossypium arboreum]|uniref:Uncharacterized protein n=1 Tax=Gossypium arboreum TaxID=29729 RepID=A0ABR0QTV3_GOSAR|nr:hypothetical protein PVK06_005117 [Gossypium arboreum]